MINGIKPLISTTTKLNIKATSFDEAMEKFCKRLEENVKPYIATMGHLESVAFGVGGGRKYIKVESFETSISKDYETGKITNNTDFNGRIHCFVESTTGDIYKPATWRAPFLKGNNCVRGNIYDTTTFEKTDLHGGWLYA